MSYKKCLVCKKEFYSNPKNELSNIRGKFCSRECWKAKVKKRIEIFKCDNCGKKFERPSWRNKSKPLNHIFCDSKCYGEYRSNNIGEYKLYSRKGKKSVASELDCDLLKKEYYSNKLRIIDIAEKYNCSYTIVNYRMKFCGITTDRTRYSDGKSEGYWKRYMRKKHKGCQVCGWDKDVCDVAHIIPRKRNGCYKEENLLYLCPNCHRLFDKGKLKI